MVSVREVLKLLLNKKGRKNKIKDMSLVTHSSLREI